MTDVTLPTTTERRRNAPVIGPKHRITAKVRTAIDAMVWQGLTRDKAAEAAGLKDHSLYVAFRSPHVKAYYLNELEVLRTSERARNINRLCEIRDAANNMPAVNAIKALEQIEDDRGSISGSSRHQVPGVIVVVNAVRQDDVSAAVVHGALTPNDGQAIDPIEDVQP